MGVTGRRERNWLMNYLAEPNKMRAAKDPIALELAARNGVCPKSGGTLQHRNSASRDQRRRPARANRAFCTDEKHPYRIHGYG
jgi:hypothetical protein